MISPLTINNLESRPESVSNVTTILVGIKRKKPDSDNGALTSIAETIALKALSEISSDIDTTAVSDAKSKKVSFIDESYTTSSTGKALSTIHLLKYLDNWQAALLLTHV
jgi:hypothetical protein